MFTPLPLEAMRDAAATTEEAGFSGIVITETGRSPFMAAAVAALAAPGLHIGTGVAAAFARSPMVTASEAWDLAEATGGRFRLGLGSQVRAHVTRRYSASFDPPGPRLREYVAAVRAIFAAFRGEPLAFEGDYWQFTLLPPLWSPGPISVADPPVDVAAVNPWMLRMAGAGADGVHVHPLNSRQYLAETVVPQVNAGAEAAGRSPAEVALMVPAFTVVGDTEDERRRWEQLARMQLGFYASTPNYWFILEQAGFDGLGEALRERQRAGDTAGMVELIDDRVLATFAIETGWSELADALVDRYGGVADRVVLYFANPALADAITMRRFGEVAAEVASRTGSPST